MGGSEDSGLLLFLGPMHRTPLFAQPQTPVFTVFLPMLSSALPKISASTVLPLTCRWEDANTWQVGVSTLNPSLSLQVCT